MVAANRTETRMQRHLLDKFIAAEPLWVDIMRPVIQRTAAGGRKKGLPIQLEPQRVRLVPFIRRLTAITRDTPDGNIINLRYVLIGEHDMDIKPADYFEYDGGIFDVLSIEPNRSYRTACNITYRGPKDAE